MSLTTVGAVLRADLTAWVEENLVMAERIRLSEERAQTLENRQFEFGGEGGIRTHVPVTRQDAFEAPPLRPLRYLSGRAQDGQAVQPQGGLKTALYTYCSRHWRDGNIRL